MILRIYRKYVLWTGCCFPGSISSSSSSVCSVKQASCCIVHVMMLEFLNLFCAGVTKQRNFTISVILFSILVHENKLGAGLAVTFSCLCRLKFTFSRFIFPNKSDSSSRARVICFGDKRNHLPKLCYFEL